MESKAVVAIVGRPKVGKSALFNRIAGERIAIVKDVPGVPRSHLCRLFMAGTSVYD